MLCVGNSCGPRLEGPPFRPPKKKNQKDEPLASIGIDIYSAVFPHFDSPFITSLIFTS
jgi:hypothetical protein